MMWRWCICTGICNFSSYVGVRTFVNGRPGIEMVFKLIFVLDFLLIFWWSVWFENTFFSVGNTNKDKSSNHSYIYYILLDKVMSHKQWHIGVHWLHLMFKGPMQLNYSVLVFKHIYAMVMFQFAQWLELILSSSNDYLLYLLQFTYTLIFSI